jgi:hypothetical protein
MSKAAQKKIMREMFLPHILSSDKLQTGVDTLCRNRNRWLTGFFVCALAGIGSGITGLLIGGLLLFGFFPPNNTPGSLETWMLVLAFPLFILAAHCLDKAAEAKKAIHSLIYKEQK